MDEFLNFLIATISLLEWFFFSPVPQPQDPNVEEYGNYNYGSYADYGEDYYGGEEGTWFYHYTMGDIGNFWLITKSRLKKIGAIFG